jgi:hypothetical protein
MGRREFSDEQRQVAEDTIADASRMWPGKVVTKISEAGPFWEAEAEDQDYLQHYPGSPDRAARAVPATAARSFVPDQRRGVGGYQPYLSSRPVSWQRLTRRDRRRNCLAGQPRRVLRHRAIPGRGRRQLDRRAARRLFVTPP